MCSWVSLPLQFAAALLSLLLWVNVCLLCNVIAYDSTNDGGIWCCFDCVCSCVCVCAALIVSAGAFGFAQVAVVAA